MNTKLIVLILASLSAIWLTHGADNCPTNDKVLFCYYANWAIYRKDMGKFTTNDIDPSLCTHLIYAFSGLSQYGGIESLDTENDYTRGGYANFTALKTQNPCLKTLLAIGGWNQGSRKYSVMASEDKYRQAFIDSVIRFLVQYDFDGLDFDWEYPSERGGIAEDKANYGLLLKELKETLSKWDLLLTIAVPISTSIMNAAYDLTAINNYVDYVLIMGYDYTPTDSATTGWLSPLNEINKTVEAWKQAVPTNKIILGVPAYGRSFTLFSSGSYVIGAATTGPGAAGDYTGEPGFLSYQEVIFCLILSVQILLYELFFLQIQAKVQSQLYTIVQDEVAQNNYAYYRNAMDWICYETEANYIAKVMHTGFKNFNGIYDEKPLHFRQTTSWITI
ncbi:chitinase [Holotrichia oblita]|uniref:Chitinase n=1 Tax=Holotrichia oblita TaxID=644536 RepID=A0ACB9SVE7_HOLOL|nr:chitinase [Holotrichia oblita]